MRTQCLSGQCTEKRGRVCVCVCPGTTLTRVRYPSLSPHFFHEPAQLNGHNHLAKELQLPAGVSSPFPTKGMVTTAFSIPGKHAGGSRSVKAYFT